jgi:hypothetical protein
MTVTSAVTVYTFRAKTFVIIFELNFEKGLPLLVLDSHALQRVYLLLKLFSST